MEESVFGCDSRVNLTSPPGTMLFFSASIPVKHSAKDVGVEQGNAKNEPVQAHVIFLVKSPFSGQIQEAGSFMQVYVLWLLESRLHFQELAHKRL